jgi:hypothetical protein
MGPGIKTEQANAEVTAIGKQLKQEYDKDMDAVSFPRDEPRKLILW